MINAVNEEMNDSLKEIQKNTIKQVGAFKVEANKSFREIQENTIKQITQNNKSVQDLKTKIEAIKKT
jgi:SAM-dependent MidA family methyltransferase